jgi:hypothetical protein
LALRVYHCALVAALWHDVGSWHSADIDLFRSEVCYRR